MNKYLLISFFFLGNLFVQNKGLRAQDMNFKELRYQMVKEQVAARGIKEKPVIKAMRKVERHLFVPNQFRHLAYSDSPLPIGFGQTISQPYIVGVMTQLLDINSKSKVLEIGTGSGYQAAILGEICKEVYSIEIVEGLALKAKSTIESLNYDNLFLKWGDGYIGWKEHAPYDAIIVTCSPRKIPQALIDQLDEDGSLVIPIGEKNIKSLVLLKKIDGELVRTDVVPVRFVPMIDEKGKEY
ncbi:MAG: protein-L-isoaspartate(D-aspartate) O-methyltransferase [Ancylomarina sp.]|jgi:protein-L-isoaspartate(D-aspartate) O-methyltransferase